MTHTVAARDYVARGVHDQGNDHGQGAGRDASSTLRTTWYRPWARLGVFFFFPFYVCLGEGRQNGDGQDDDDVTEIIEIQGRLGERRRPHCAFLDPE